MRPTARICRLGTILSICLLFPALAAAQDVPAKQLFGTVAKGSNSPPRAFGSYVRGCLAGGQMLPVDGEGWQAMRLSRNRNWGHPTLVAYVTRLAKESKAIDGWPGLLVGDLAQPRGGPMMSGHRSHQVGLDAENFTSTRIDSIDLHFHLKFIFQ